MKRLALLAGCTFLVAIISVFSGCMTPQGDGTMDGVEESFTHQPVQKRNAEEIANHLEETSAADRGTGLEAKREIKLPFVEGYIEFPGPQDKWAGPPSLLVHVTAKDPGTARLQVTPQIFQPTMKEQSPQVVRRVLASEGLSSQSAREQLRKLADSMQGVEPIFNGCLYPVRVRLVRSDGSVFEKQGCRGRVGWPRVASESVDFFLNSSLANNN